MSFVIKLAATIVAGIVLGLAATWAVVEFRMPGEVRDGPWSTNLLIGSAASDPYTRAAVAVHGLFALNASEIIYYLATTDDRGLHLNGACTYMLEGRDPEARWWSVTAYGEDEYLIPNPTDRYSVDKSSVWRRNDGRFSISVGTRPQPSNWIPVTSGRFSLVLRLFNPGRGVSSLPSHAILPSIRNLGCT